MKGLFYVYTDRLANVHGQYSDSAVNQCSMLIGTQGKDIDNLFSTNVAGSSSHGAKRRLDVNAGSVKKFVQLYKRHNLWEYIPKRKHGAFPRMTNVVCVKKTAKFGARLKKYSKDMSKEQRMYVFK